MSNNSCGVLFSYTTFGESHGSAIGCVIDGCPALLPLDESLIQPDLDRRRPGRSLYTTAREESDKVRILSGVFEGFTTGTPIALLIDNHDQRSKDYANLQDTFRPGHADYTYQLKYGIRDHRGGGRSSARETAMRVAAGAVAKVLLKHLPMTRDIKITGSLISIGKIRTNASNYCLEEIDRNGFFCADSDAVDEIKLLLDSVIARGSSVGGVVEVRVSNMPVGLGEPLYDKLDARLAHVCMGLNAVKGVEIGDGFQSTQLFGEEHNDQMTIKDGKPVFLSNHAGGILGGISSGQDLIIRCAIKPTSSLAIVQETITKNFEPTSIITHGRHDPCVAIRAVPVLEAMVACVLADFALLAQSGNKIC